MDSVILSADILDVVNDVLNDITGYGNDRKINFTVEIKENEFNKLEVKLIYNDTNKVVFEGAFYQKDLSEAIQNEDEKNIAKHKEK